MRLFFAIDLPDAVKRNLSGIQERLKATGVRATWPRPDGMHITIAFLGEQDPAIVPRLLDIAREAARAIGPFSLVTAGTGGFPSRHSARVLASGLENAPELPLLAGRLALGLSGAGIPFDEKPFKAHITIARFKAPTDSGGLDAGFPGMSFEVREITLFESVLSPEGARYASAGRVSL